MRILAIGLGGAGCRIVNSLYSTDRRSSRVACVQALAVDVDEITIAQLTDLPENAKLSFPALEPGTADLSGASMCTATVDIDEVIARIQNIEISEMDAIFICCGLGGSMVDVAPRVITALRSSVVEPIFGLVTLPGLYEGEKRSAKAADDLEMLSQLLDGVVLFDNETWSKKVKGKKLLPLQSDTGFAEMLGIKKAKQVRSPDDDMHALLNEGIIKRISLILRAGEFKADGGIELAEVVMDSGEVLNTMKGMGFITIGYAVEHLPHHAFDFISKWRPVGFFADEHKKRDSRIVELAKQAIYNEVSTPCDMTSAAKALILIAGPSQELSMKGFMTVRKWIDRSIAGLETRSGDYPVTNTKYVAIIIMLAGLENIPRITELKEIRAQYNAGLRRGPISQRGGSAAGLAGESPFDSFPEDLSSISARIGKKDEMIVLPGKDVKPSRYGDDYPHRTATAEPVSSRMEHDRIIAPEKTNPPVRVPDSESRIKTIPVPETMTRIHEDHEPARVMGSTPPTRVPETSPQAPHRHIVTSGPREISTRGECAQPGTHEHTVTAHIPPGEVKRVSPSFHEEKTDHVPQVKDDQSKTKEQERQRIERELQRQRMLAISGKLTQKKEPAVQVQKNHSPHLEETKTIIRRSTQPKKEFTATEVSKHAHEEIRENRVLIKTKRKPEPPEEPEMPENDPEPVTVPEVIREDVSVQREYSNRRDSSGKNISMNDTFRRAKDEVFIGKEISMKVQPRVNDDSLLHSRLKPQKSLGGSTSAPQSRSTERSSKIKHKQDTEQTDDADPS